MLCSALRHVFTLFLSAASSEFIDAAAFTNGICTLDNLSFKGTVVCGFLTNGLVDSYDGEGDIQAILSTTINIYCNAINIAQDNNKCKFVVLLPFSRPKPDWLKPQLPFVHKLIEKKLGTNDNIEIIQALPIPEQLFEKDGIHLNELGQSMVHAHWMSTISVFKRSLRSVSRMSISDDQDVFEDASATASGRKRQGSPTPDIPNKTSKQEKEQTDHNPTTSSSTDDGIRIRVDDCPANITLDTIRNTISSEMGKFLTAQSNTNKVISERVHAVETEILLANETADAAMNQSNRNIVLVSGIRGTLLKDRKDKNKQAIKVAHTFLDAIEVGKIDLMFATFIPGPPPNPGCLPMLKLALGSVGDATHVRNKFNAARKADQRTWADVYLTPELTKTTRVRAAILAAMCKKKKVQDLVRNAQPQVTKFEIKPDICYRNTRSGKIEKRIGFKEACDRFMSLLKEEDLVIAKKIAGRALASRLRNLFCLKNSE